LCLLIFLFFYFIIFLFFFFLIFFFFFLFKTSFKEREFPPFPYGGQRVSSVLEIYQIMEGGKPVKIVKVNGFGYRSTRVAAAFWVVKGPIH